MFTEFFVDHLRKILKPLDYFVAKFELISSIEVSFQENRRKMTKSANKDAYYCLVIIFPRYKSILSCQTMIFQIFIWGELSLKVYIVTLSQLMELSDFLDIIKYLALR